MTSAAKQFPRLLKNTSIILCILLTPLPIASASASRSPAVAPPTYVPGERLIQRSKPLEITANLAWITTVIEPGVISSVRELRGIPGLLKVVFKDESAAQQSSMTLARSSEVRFVEPNYILRTLKTFPNDPKFKETWALANPMRADIDIGVTPLWRRGITGKSDVIVAVVDTGIELTHPDLAANIYTNPGEAGALANNGIDDDGNGYIDDVHGWNFIADNNNTNDDEGHGTHCAGTIGAVGQNGQGIAGINWSVSLLPVKMLNASGSGTAEQAAEALIYARKMGARIVNASWGAYEFSQTMEDAIHAVSDAGILVAAAAGNDAVDNDIEPMYPAGTDAAALVAVAAIEVHGKPASFTNFGARSVHVAAPGESIMSTTLGGTYRLLSGTSMAAPQVAGVAALLMSAEPTLSAVEIKARLIRSSRKSYRLEGKIVSGGIINAEAAFDDVVPARLPEPDPNAWKSKNMTFESAHPYMSGSNILTRIKVSGAKYMRVVFDRLDLENGYDFVYVEEKKDDVVQSWTGSHVNVYSDEVVGSELKLRLLSDSAKTDYGFKVKRVEYQ